MNLFAKILTVIGLSVCSAITMADPTYVQALPTADNSSTVQSTNQNSSTDIQALNPQQSAQPVKKAKHHLFSHNGSSTQTVSSPMDDAAQNTLLLSRVMQVNQDFLNYQSKTTDQINQLNSANQQLKQQVSDLAGQLAMVQTKLDASNQSQMNNAGGIAAMVAQFGLMPFYIIVAIFALLLIIIILLLVARKKTPAPVVKEDVKSDYDYLSTKEAIPAKLDLARSYIVMEDFAAAKEVLQGVLKSGDDAQKKLANELLAQCHSDKKDG